MILNNDAEPESDGKITGEPTEAALLEAGLAADPEGRVRKDRWIRAWELPFDAERRRMTTLHEGPEGKLAIMKGAPGNGATALPG